MDVLTNFLLNEHVYRNLPPLSVELRLDQSPCWDGLWWGSLLPPSLLIAHHLAWHCALVLSFPPAEKRIMPPPPYVLTLRGMSSAPSRDESSTSPVPAALWQEHVFPYLPTTAMANLALTSRRFYQMCHAYDQYVAVKASALVCCNLGQFMTHVRSYAKWLSNRESHPHAKEKLMVTVEQVHQRMQRQIQASSQALTTARLPQYTILGFLSITNRSYLNPGADFRAMVCFNWVLVGSTFAWLPRVQKLWPRQTVVVSNYMFLFSLAMHLMHLSHRLFDSDSIMDPNAVPHPVPIFFCITAAFSFGGCFLYCAMYDLTQYFEPVLPLSIAIKATTAKLLSLSRTLRQLKKLTRFLRRIFNRDHLPHGS